MGRIVVGVDGSELGAAALRWAAEEARLRNATLVAVHAWAYPYIADMAYLAASAVDAEGLARDAEAVLGRSLAEVDLSGVDVERVVTEGSAAGALLEAAEGADMVVVGSRGHGGFTGLLLGSVSQQLAHHATCPVVIVHPPR